MSETRRTGVQRRTLAGALLLAAMAGAGVLALVDDTDGGNSQRVSDTATTAEPVVTEPITTAASEAPPAAPAPEPTTAKPPIEQRVDDHEQRIDTLEATTTVAPTTSKPTPPPTTMTPTTNCYQPDKSGDCDPSNNG